jgi:N-acetylglutamate synthase-like GNAT family acetyltransferase
MNSERNEGLGKTLVAHTEQVLYGNSVEHIYLTSDEAGGFWNLCGYVNSDKVSNLNHIPIYEK